MKYRLKKDLPWAKAGTIVGDSLKSSQTSYVTIPGGGTFGFPTATFSDWFEEVDERWKPENGTRFFYIETGGGIACDKYLNGQSYLERMHAEGRIFRTRELAERAAEQIKALLKEFHKNNP